MKRCSLLLAIAITLTSTAFAHDYVLGEIHIMEPWSRPLPAVSVNGAAYMTLMNNGKAADKLIAISTPAARKATLHHHISEGGMMKMRPVEAVAIMPGEPSVMQPGGLHIMLMGLTVPLVEGNSFPLTLTFERAGSIGVEVIIFAPEGTSPGHMKNDKKMEGG
jgi:hypothetical protein